MCEEGGGSTLISMKLLDIKSTIMALLLEFTETFNVMACGRCWSVPKLPERFSCMLLQGCCAIQFCAALMVRAGPHVAEEEEGVHEDVAAHDTKARSTQRN